MRVIIGLVLALVSCSAPSTLAAEGAYTGDLLRCVDNAHTLAESRQCRQLVNERWGIVEVEAGAPGRDGGAP